MELIVVSLPDYFEGEGELINELFAEGLHLFHLRKLEKDAEKFRKLMREIDPEYYPLISIHQHHELAGEFALRRLHFKEQDRILKRAAELGELKKQAYVLSSSIHELSALPDLEYFDYVFFGPVYNSISKKGYQSILNVDFVLPPHLVKVFAIGGITAGQLSELKHMDFDGAVVLGTIWQQPDAPLTAFKKLKHTINELQ